MTTPLANLHHAARAHSRAAARLDALRATRDEAIRQAAAAGMGIREIARAAGIDPSLVSRIVRR